MFRFGSIALGLLFLGFGIYLRWFEEPMSSAPVATTLEEVERLSRSAGEEHFVDFPGTIDLSGKLFRTGIETPAYAPCDPREVHTLQDNLSDLVGCRVVLPDAPDVDVATVVASRSDADLSSGDALRQRILLAPVSARRDLWVLSPSFLHHADTQDPAGSSYRIDFGRGPLFSMPNVTTEEEAWIRTEALEGPLARLSDLPELSDDFERGPFAEGLRLAMGLDEAEAAAAYVVLADGRRPIERPAKRGLPHAIAPVKEAANLVVALNWDEEPEPRRITGVLEPFGAIPGGSVIHSRTPEDVNQERVSTANTAMVIGVVLIGFGGVLIALVRLLEHTGREMRRARARARR